MLEEDRMDAVLQRAAVLDQVQPEAGPLPLGTHRRVGQPDLRDQVAAGELGQHEAVDLVCFAGGASPRAYRRPSAGPKPSVHQRSGNGPGRVASGALLEGRMVRC